MLSCSPTGIVSTVSTAIAGGGALKAFQSVTALKASRSSPAVMHQAGSPPDALVRPARDSSVATYVLAGVCATLIIVMVVSHLRFKVNKHRLLCRVLARAADVSALCPAPFEEFAGDISEVCQLHPVSSHLRPRLAVDLSDQCLFNFISNNPMNGGKSCVSCRRLLGFHSYSASACCLDSLSQSMRRS